MTAAGAADAEACAAAVILVMLASRGFRRRHEAAAFGPGAEMPPVRRQVARAAGIPAFNLSR
jgi:hypothetical protein